MQEQHRKELSDKEEHYNNQIEQLQEQHRKELSDKEEHYKNQIEQLHEKYRKELSNNGSNYSSEFETFKVKVSQGVKELNDEIAQLKSLIRVQDETIYEMKHGSFFVKLKHLFTS